MRILRSGAALALALGVSVANAAGLGKLTVNSALGQILNAEIDLVSLQPGELESLTARVATPENFRDARIEYSPALRLLRFAVEKRANGVPFLKVTSVAPINEPFVDVLIEVTWPAGRVQREYPILLDPPGYAQKATPPTVAAAPSAAQSTPPASAPAAPSQAPAAEPSQPAAQPSGNAASPSATGGPSARAEMGSGAPREASGDTYGPVQKGDTLRKIAEETKPSNVSLEQMLVALYRENKSAFAGNNMNRLKTGQILKVPSSAEVEKLAKPDVNKEIRTHVADWNTYRGQVASGVAASPAPSSDAPNAATGRVGSAAVTPPPAPVADNNKDVLKITKNDAAGKAGAGKAGGAANQERLNAMQEELTAKNKALNEANSRVADLEKQIRDMQRLMDLKGGAAGKADTKVATAPVPPPAVTPAKPGAQSDTKPAEPVKTPEPPKADATKPADTKAATPTPTPAPSSTTTTTTDTKSTDTKVATATPSEPAKADATKPAEPPKADAAKPAAKKAAPPPKQRDFTDDLADNWPLLAGLGVLAAGGIGALMFMRNRRRRYEDGPSSNMTSAFPSDLKPDSNTSKPAGGLVDTGNSSFLTDFDKTGPGTIDTDEVDPVAEAEVYIAYGRDAQAEEILKEAMARDKNRHEIALKLLEIYHARKSATAFETVAKELRNSVGENHPLWQKAAAMGAQIDPNNPLYVGAGNATSTYQAMAPAAAAAAAPAAAPKPDLDFDLESGSTQTNMQAQSSAPAPDFDLDLDSKPAHASGAAAPDHGLDFNIEASQHGRAPTVDVPLHDTPKDDKPSFDFDLSGLDFPSSKPAASSPAAETKPNMDLTDLSLDLGDTGAGGGEAVGTKLELAKAYLEIGDKDGAREILQEVAKEGSSAQKEEAQKLIASL